MAGELSQAITAMVEHNTLIDHQVSLRLDRMAGIVEKAVQGLEGSAAQMAASTEEQREEMAAIAQTSTVTQNLITEFDRKADQRFSELHNLLSMIGGLLDRQTAIAEQNARTADTLATTVRMLLERDVA